MECSMHSVHELFNAGGGFGRPNKGEVQEGEIYWAGAVKRVLDDSQCFSLISAGHGDLG